MTNTYVLTLGRIMLILALCSLILVSTQPLAAQEMKPQSSGIVKNVMNAPVIGDGTVAGAVTEFVINLDVSIDPTVPGKTLLEGNTIRVTLPDEFVNSGEPALENIMSNDECTPANMLCTAAVMVQGWPQRPVPPPWYDMSIEGTNTLVVTALRDIVPNPPTFAGIKVIHLMFKSFTNPAEPGFYSLDVVAETGPAGTVETGTAVVEILPRAIPHMGITSVFNEGAPNTIYQNAGLNEATPFAYDLLLWNYDSEPMVGVGIEPLGPNLWGLVQDEQIVGIANVQAPAGATGMRFYNEEPSTEINAPLTKAPTGRLRAFFQIGSVPGEYVVQVYLLNGNSQQMFVNGTTALTQSFTRLPEDTEDPDGNTVIANCDGEPYENAAATITIDQLYRNSTAHITLKNARPNTFYTLWLRLRGITEGDDGDIYGGSPITDAGSTPLAPSTELSNLIASGVEGAGNIDVANGFMTGSDGSGSTSIELDFPLLGGAYPFHKAYPNLAPVPIVGAPVAPFMVRLVSHCTDNVGHGVNAGAREPWFDWSP